MAKRQAAATHPKAAPGQLLSNRHGNARKQAQQCENCETEPALHFRVLP